MTPKLAGDGTMIALGLTTTAAVACVAIWYARRNKPPEKWVKVGQVGDLYLYPVKSCRWVKLEELECTALGSRSGEVRDRMFVVVDEEGQFVTGRDYPRLTQVEALIRNGKLIFSAPNYGETVEFDFHELKNQPQEVKIWGATGQGIDCGDHAAKWLSRFVLLKDTGLRLLYYGDRNEPMGANANFQKVIKFHRKDFRTADSSLFSDAAAYHLISEASVRELNSRLTDEMVTPLNFRPNIVVQGDNLLPFEEDSWDWLKIGEVVFRVLAPCGRCLFTTVNPIISKKSENQEPLSTLRKYRISRNPDERKVLQSPAMGIYLGVRTSGSITVGDDVFVPAH